MADQKDKAAQKKLDDRGDHNDEQASGYGRSGGNMGAGRSGKEGMGSEKPSEAKGMGSQKPGADHENHEKHSGYVEETESEKSGITDSEESEE
jgi:hypothetical protein